ncbi:MAG: GNAT family N-acetyltransferase [Clostridia bacterium]|nr:GNAT family N-acetyltransferase [Clostridia bacterium]
MLKELIKAAKKGGAKKVFLEVRVSNSNAMKLYLKNGFKGVYARTRYYSDGEDGLVMVKEL